MGMSLTSKPPRWTAALVRAFPEDGNRYEVIGGELLVTPSPRREHQRAVLELAAELRSWLKGEDVGEVSVSPADLELEPDDLLQPDVFVSPVGKAWTDVRSLSLAVEVLSPSTRGQDRGRKRHFFSRVGVPEYWIVDCDQRCVERWRPGAAAPEILVESLEWLPAGATVAFVLDLVAFFIAVHRDDRLS